LPGISIFERLERKWEEMGGKLDLLRMGMRIYQIKLF
jgi:hypothetical protein